MTGTAIAQAIPLAASPFLTRLYMPDEGGIFALFIAVVGIFSVLSSGRYEMALLLPKKESEAMHILGLAFSINFAVSLMLLCMIVFFHDGLSELFDNSQMDFWLYFIPLTVFVVGLFNQLSIFNNRQKHYRDIAQASIVKSIVLVLVQLGMGFAKAGVSGLISGQIAAHLSANMKLARNIFSGKNRCTSFSRVKMAVLAKRYMDFPKFQMPHALLNTFSSHMPVYLFSFFVGSLSVGLFALSIRVVLAPLMMIAVSSAKVYNQTLTQRYQNREELFFFKVSLLKRLSKRTLGPFVICMIFAPEIFVFVFGDPWYRAGVYTQILSPWFFMVYVVTVVSYVPSLLNLQKKALKIEIVYSLLRFSGLAVGLYFFDELTALVLFSLTGVVVLGYNLVWILHSLRQVG